MGAGGTRCARWRVGRAVARVAPCGLLELPGLGSLASMPSSTCDTRWLSIAKALDSFCRKSVVAALGARCARAHSPLRPADDLQHMRVMERRFIIWTSRDAPEDERRQQQQQPHPELTARRLPAAAAAGAGASLATKPLFLVLRTMHRNSSIILSSVLRRGVSIEAEEWVPSLSVLAAARVEGGVPAAPTPAAVAAAGVDG